MITRPSVSVIIPTYNRYKYLKGCLSSISSLSSDDLEVIVQDNTEDNTEILDYIRGLNDDRIKYYHIREHICVSDNCDAAMSHASGKYICMIGDDDSICDTLVDAAKFCEREGIDAANYIVPGFNWPDMTFEGKKKEANLFFPQKADGIVSIINAKDELLKAMHSAVGLLGTMPRAYHGLVSKKLMDEIFSITGSYFPGPSPDMGNATAVGLLSKKSAYIRDYLIVSGYGYTSARGEGRRNQHYGKLDEKPWLPKDILERWDKDIPPIFSGETITADSLTEALKRMHKEELVKQYNYSALYAEFLFVHKNAFKQMMKFCFSSPSHLMRMIYGVLARIPKVIRYRMNPPSTANFQEQSDVRELADAQMLVMNLRGELQVSELRMED